MKKIDYTQGISTLFGRKDNRKGVMKFRKGDQVRHINDSEDQGRIVGVCETCTGIEQCCYPYFVVWALGEAEWFAEADLELDN